MRAKDAGAKLPNDMGHRKADFPRMIPEVESPTSGEAAIYRVTIQFQPRFRTKRRSIFLHCGLCTVAEFEEKEIKAAAIEIRYMSSNSEPNETVIQNEPNVAARRGGPLHAVFYIRDVGFTFFLRLPKTFCEQSHINVDHHPLTSFN